MTPLSANRWNPVRKNRAGSRARRAGGMLACLLGLLLLSGAADPPAVEPDPDLTSSAPPAVETPASTEAATESPATESPAAESTPGPTPEPAAGKHGRLVRVPLPILGTADTQVIAAARQALAGLPPGAERPVLVLEFSSSDNQTGAGSDFERSLKLARFLSSSEASAVETVAYIPKALKGHAVLAAMACESIILGPDAVIGEAGLDEPAEQTTDPTVRSGYREIANRRRTIPAEVALAMLDKNVELLKVETEVSPEYILAEDLDALKQKHSITSQKVLSPAGQFALFKGSEARSEGFAKYLADDRTALARALSIPAKELEDDPSLLGGWRPVEVAVSGPITDILVSRVQRTITQQVRDHSVNLIVLRIDSPGGSLVDSMNLANFIAEQNPAVVRIVAYVPQQALSDASLVALAADQLVMQPTAVLGGGGGTEFSRAELDSTAQTLRDSLAKKRGRSWSLMAALIDPQMRVFEYTNRQTGAVAYFSTDEQTAQANPDDWKQGAEITRPGQALKLSGDRALQLGLARHVVQNFADLKQQFGLEGDVALAEPNWADFLVQALAAPAVAWLLLLIGGAAIYAELQAPGIGIGAFIAGICFLLYFWSKHLGGTADWLEVCLFVAGVACILLELFVLPGVAIFGLGGGVMIIASLVLASQTFVIPHNEYQLSQLRDSLLGLLGAGVGIGVLAMLMQRYLPHTPLFNNMMLEPPSGAELEHISQRESLVSFGYLLGMQGTTTTQLTPSGKARFDGKQIDVIADGEVIGRGEAVVVTEVHGNRVVVRSAANA
jgi:membrane-bound serine protease (ClpP class)